MLLRSILSLGLGPDGVKLYIISVFLVTTASFTLLCLFMYHILHSHICPATWGNRIQMTQRWRNFLQLLLLSTRFTTYQALLILYHSCWRFSVCHSGLVLRVNLISVSLPFLLGKRAQSRLDLLQFQFFVVHQRRSLPFRQHTWIHNSFPLFLLHRLATVLHIDIPGWNFRFNWMHVACTRCIATQTFRKWNYSNLLVLIMRLLLVCRVRVWKLRSFLVGSRKLSRYDRESLSFNLFLISLIP